MGRLAIFGTGLFSLLFLVSAVLADPQEPSDNDLPVVEAPVPAESDAAIVQKAAPIDSAPAVGRAIDNNLDSRGRAVRIDKDGFVYGYVHYIDPHSLEQVPVSGAIVTFMQDCVITAQAKSGADGRFAVKGLSPYAVYSMFVRSELWVCMMGTYVLPEDSGEAPVAADDTAMNKARTNTFTFASQPLVVEGTDNVQSAEGDPRIHAIQVVPLRDFICAIQQGLFGDICGGVGGGACCPLPAGGAGGGGGGAGYGGAAAAALAAAAAAWGSGAGGEDNELASPFSPGNGGSSGGGDGGNGVQR